MIYKFKKIGLASTIHVILLYALYRKKIKTYLANADELTNKIIVFISA